MIRYNQGGVKHTDNHFRFAVLSVLLAGGIGLPVWSDPVSPDSIRQAAERWLVLCGAGYSVSGPPPAVKADAIPLRDDDGRILAWHVPLAPAGYLILQADDRLAPVRAFSLESDLELEVSIDNALRAMLWKDQRVAAVVLQDLDAGKIVTAAVADGMAANRSAWSALLGPAPLALPPPTNILVQPMLQTVWSQWRNYNAYCPVTGDTNVYTAGRCPVGCVAVTGSQLMKHYAWPSRGYGTHAYVDALDTITGAFSAVYSDAYDWGQMLTNYNVWKTNYPPEQVHAVSEIIYETGVAVNMNYEPGGSTASLQGLCSALGEHFRFSQGVYSTTSSASFLPQLRQELLRRRPVPAGISNHAFVLDGLSSDSQTNVVHVSYGWNGVNDGWYLVSDITGQSLMDALFGVEPLAEAVMPESASGTNFSGIVQAMWDFPDWHTARVARFRLDQGAFMATNMANSCDQLGEWLSLGDPWVVSNTLGNPGGCYYKNDNLQEGWLNLPPLKTATNSMVRFSYYMLLYDSPLLFQGSTNDGLSWTTFFQRAGDYRSWNATNISLSAWTNRNVQLRFGYTRGTLYYIGGQARLDNITLSNMNALTWTELTTNIPAGVRSWTCTSAVDGLAYYRVQAHTGASWLASSAIASVYTDTAGDMDGDQLPNGWEYRWSQTPTGLVASADDDGDTHSNLTEYRIGTCPTNRFSALNLTGIVWTNRPGLSWQTVSGHLYSVWRSTNLMNPAGFTILASGLVARSESFSQGDTNPPLGGPVFYRITTE